jgi:cytochrome oxidase Cu insertion factor (SCO1/SenC/PrrC family)
MDDTTRRLSRTIYLGVGLVIVLICVAFIVGRLQPGGQINASDALPVIGPVADFTLTNQDGQVVTLAGLRGHVWVGDIIFTRCPGPCIRMTRQMKSLQDALPPGNDVKLVTLTTDPEYDTPAILKKYADHAGADASRWTFLTGTKKEIGGLAVNSLKLAAVEIKPEDRASPDDLFVHSTMFVLMDKQARLRGVYETGGEGVEWTNVQPAIIANIQKLESEP